MLRSALFLVASLVATPVLAAADMTIDDSGDGGLVARNTGSQVLVVQSGQLNYREDCELVPMLLTRVGGELFGGLADEAAQTEAWKVFTGSGKITSGPSTLRPGEAIRVLFDTSPCSKGGSEVIAVTVRTDKGEFSFSAQ